MYIYYKLLIVLRFMNHRIDDRKETYQCYGWCYYDTTGTENISIEGMLVRTGTTHQQKTDDDNRHSDA